MTILMLTPVIWLTIILAAIFAEAISQSGMTIWLAPASFAAFIGCICGLSVWKQTLIFAGGTVLFLFSSWIVKSIWRHFLKKSPHKTKDNRIE